MQAMSWRGLIAGLLALAGAGCAASTPSDPEPPIEVVVVDDLRSLGLPLDRYRHAGREQELEARAHLILLERCTSRFGFGFQIPDELPEVIALQGHERTWGIADVDTAHRYGYSGPVDQPPSYGDYFPQSDTFTSIAFGDGPREHDGIPVPEGGCVGEAHRELASGAKPLDELDLGQQLSIEAHQLAERDSRVQAAYRKWSGCMAGKGYDYDDPWQANDDPRFEGEGAGEEEIAVAVADVECKTRVALIDLRVAVERAYQERLISANADPLRELAAALETRRNNAERIISGTG